MTTIEDLGEAAVTPVDADTLARQRALIDMERWALHRWLGYSPSAVRVDWLRSDPTYGGAATPRDVTVDGNEQDPFHGVAIFNPTPWAIGLGFQGGQSARPILTVAPFSWLSVPERYVNLGLRLLAPTLSGALDQSAAPLTNVPVSVAVLRLRIPPLGPAAGALPAPELRGIAIPAGTAIGAAGSSVALVSVAGARLLTVSASLVTVTAADLGVAAFPVEPDGNVGALSLPPSASNGPTLAGGSSRMVRQFDVSGLDVVQIAVTNAGGATTAAATWWAK